MNHIEEAIRIIEVEAQTVLDLKQSLSCNFELIVKTILESSGRVILCGIGKSGHIAKKIFATFVSTGTPSFYIHPGEALHGDLGLILPNDIFLAISNSGETEEILRLIPFIQDNKNLLISMTGNEYSTLAKNSNFHIHIPVQQEACPLKLAPTSSATAALVMGDALALTLMKARAFKQEDFARFHPGGSLCRKLISKVRDYTQGTVFIHPCSCFKTIVTSLTESSIGVVCVGEPNHLIGMITDGDLRRSFSIQPREKIFEIQAKDIMSRNPLSVSPRVHCSDADQIMKEKRINSLIVKDGELVLGIYQNLNKLKLTKKKFTLPVQSSTV